MSKRNKFMNYILYYADLPDELPQELLYDDWQSEYLIDYFLRAAYEDDESVSYDHRVFMYRPWCCYIYRKHKLPPKNWFYDKNRENTSCLEYSLLEIIY